MPKYIKKKDLKNAIDECTWYHIGKGGELVEGANSSEHEPLYKYSDIKEIIKNLPTRKFETEPKRTALSKALKWTYGDDRKTENRSEKPNNCEPTWEQVKEYCNKRCLDIVDSAMRKQWYKDEPQTCEECEHWNDTKDGCADRHGCKIEPQTQLTAKCLECNNSKACKEKHWDGCLYEPLGYEVTAVVGTITDEPHTERSE